MDPAMPPSWEPKEAADPNQSVRKIEKKMRETKPD